MLSWQTSSLLPSQRTLSMKSEKSVSINNLVNYSLLSHPRVEKEPEFKSETVDEVSDVSSNELSGPEDGECESGNGEFPVKLLRLS